MLGNTPMMMQYEEIKKDYQDCLLFYRLGDFYEMFGPDAEAGSRLLGITLTARDGGMGKIPMCGVPFHSADNYIAKVIRAGQKVAICEQVEDPKSAKGIVKREVIRVISPGTILKAIICKSAAAIICWLFPAVKTVPMVWRLQMLLPVNLWPQRYRIGIHCTTSSGGMTQWNV